MRGMMKQHTLQDLAASIVAVTLVVAVSVLGVLERPVPDAISTGLGAAITWLFMRSAQQAEASLADNHDRAH